MKNVFFKDDKEETLESILGECTGKRENLGEFIPVSVYRLLEYSLKIELRNRLGKDEQISIFRNAGKMAGDFFARHYLNLSLPFEEFISSLQKTLEDNKIGVLRIEKIDEEKRKIVLTVSEDADCSGLPVLGETVCNYDEGFISGILTTYTGVEYTAIEVDCWATGDRVCRFNVNAKESD